MNSPFEGMLDIETIGDSNEKNFYLYILNISQSFLRFLINGYHYLGPPIDLRVLNTIAKHASAFEDDANRIIRVSRGMIHHCVQQPSEMEWDTCIRFNKLGKLGAQIAAAPLLSIIAHEFFHIARGHKRLRDLSWEIYSQPTEYDADCFGAAGVYRYLQAQKSPLVDLGVKIICLRAFYRTMRPFIGFDEIVRTRGKPHPDMYLRLRYVFYKIASMDLPSANFGITQIWYDSFDIIIPEYVKAEKEYLESFGAAGRKSEFFRATLKSMEEEDAPLKELVDRWTAIEPEVLAHSRLVLDMVQSGKSVFFLHPTHGMIFMQGGWRYAMGRVTGFFVPRFHLKKGLSGQSVCYGAENTFVKALWVAGSQNPW